jgi:hypothetical protein
MSHRCRYCCKSPKLPGDNFPAIRRSDRRPPICVASITLPRSPVSLSSGNEVPHIFTRKSHLQPGEFLVTSAKRLLQQYLPKADSCSATNKVKGSSDFKRPIHAHYIYIFIYICSSSLERVVRERARTPENIMEGVYAACRQPKIWRVRFSYAHMKTASIKAALTKRLDLVGAGRRDV